MLFFPTILYKKPNQQQPTERLSVFCYSLLLFLFIGDSVVCSFLFISLEKFVTASSIPQILIEKENRESKFKEIDELNEAYQLHPKIQHQNHLNCMLQRSAFQCFRYKINIYIYIYKSKQMLHRLR